MHRNQQLLTLLLVTDTELGMSMIALPPRRNYAFVPSKESRSENPIRAAGTDPDQLRLGLVSSYRYMNPSKG